MSTRYINFDFPKSNLIPQSGRLLIAQPLMKDTHFSRSVICLCEHKENGTVGYIINDVTDLELHELITEIGNNSVKLFYGGPVQEDTLHIIHRIPKLLGGIEISKGIYWGGSFEILKNLLASKTDINKDVKLILGYSGWSQGQLEGEIKGGSWFVAEMNQQLVFDIDVSEVWKKSIDMLGADYEFLKNIPVNPHLN